MKKPIGFELKVPEGSKIAFIPFDEETKEYINKQFTEKGYIDYLTEFIGGKKNYEIAEKALHDSMHKSLAPSVQEQCLYCNGKSDNEADKSCQIYYLQMKFTFLIASQEFIRIAINNKSIYNDKSALQRLTINFFNSLNFIKNEGKMYLDLEQLCRFALEANFEALSRVFAQSEILKTLDIINDAIDELDQKELHNKVQIKEDEDYIDLQKEFLEKKQKFYREKHFIEKEKSQIQINPRKTKKPKITVAKYALFYYYLQVGGYYPFFENHPLGKIEAIRELLVKEKLTSLKSFQLAYNQINNSTTNRISKKQSINIQFVANQMLNDYPNSKKIALSEYKLALTKSR